MISGKNSNFVTSLRGNRPGAPMRRKIEKTTKSEKQLKEKTMPTYALYKLMFKKTDDKELFDRENNPKEVSRALELLEQLLKSDIQFGKRKRDDDWERLEHSVEAQRDHVLLLMLKNNKSKNYLEGRDERNLKYHPGCYLLFDCREEVAQLAIERIASFDNKPDKVSEILAHTLGKALRPFGLDIEIRPKMREGHFWAAVEEQTLKMKDQVKRVVFSFPKQDHIGPVDGTEYMRSKVVLLQSLLHSVNAAKGQLKMEADKKKTLLLDRTQQDMAQLVSLCCRNGYHIAVHFRRYGVYRFGDQVRAFDSLDEEVIDQFIYGQKTIGDQSWRLLEWLDEARTRTLNYNATPDETADDETETAD